MQKYIFYLIVNKVLTKSKWYDRIISVLNVNTLYVREWLSGRASPCQGEGREFESRFALFFTNMRKSHISENGTF